MLSRGAILMSQMMKKSFQSRQGGRPLSKYYNELNSIFLELDYRRPNDMECVKDIEKQNKTYC